MVNNMAVLNDKTKPFCRILILIFMKSCILGTISIFSFQFFFLRKVMSLFVIVLRITLLQFNQESNVAFSPVILVGFFSFGILNFQGILDGTV